MLCSLSFGSYFCFDNPAALHVEFLSDLNMSESRYMGLYAWYSWPNVVLSFAGGFLIDRVFGVRLGACIFSLFCICGQFVFSAGAFSDLVWLCYAGRFIFGIGGESLAVAQNTYTCRWFSGTWYNGEGGHISKCLQNFDFWLKISKFSGKFWIKVDPIFTAEKLRVCAVSCGTFPKHNK